MSANFRVLVTGSRDWVDSKRIFSALDEIASDVGIGRMVVIHGSAKGADSLADAWARSNNVKLERHPADWGLYGRSAGPRRNADMVRLGADICLAFIRNNSRGATHCAALAQASGIFVRRFTERG